MNGAAHYSMPSWRTALAAQCPRCAKGRLFAGFLKLRERCDHCGLDLTKAESADGPAVFITLGVGLLIVAAMAIVEVRYQPSIWVHVAIWPLLGVVLSLLCMRPLKAFFVAQQFRHQAHEGSISDAEP
jgi:uncharacterized protein (DUF983 family)